MGKERKDNIVGGGAFSSSDLSLLIFKTNTSDSQRCLVQFILRLCVQGCGSGWSLPGSGSNPRERIGSDRPEKPDQKAIRLRIRPNHIYN